MPVRTTKVKLDGFGIIAFVKTEVLSSNACQAKEGDELCQCASVL